MDVWYVFAQEVRTCCLDGMADGPGGFFLQDGHQEVLQEVLQDVERVLCAIAKVLWMTVLLWTMELWLMVVMVCQGRKVRA